MDFKVFTRSGLLIFPFGDVNITLVKIKRASRFSGETLRQALRAVLKGCPNQANSGGLIVTHSELRIITAKCRFQVSCAWRTTSHLSEANLLKPALARGELRCIGPEPQISDGSNSFTLFSSAHFCGFSSVSAGAAKSTGSDPFDLPAWAWRQTKLGCQTKKRDQTQISWTKHKPTNLKRSLEVAFAWGGAGNNPVACKRLPFLVASNILSLCF